MASKYSDKPKKMKDSDIFEGAKNNKKMPKSRPKKTEKEDGVFEATEGKIKEGGLRKALKVDDDYVFKIGVINKLLKHEVGDRFEFEDNKIKMTERLKKQLQLAKNMMK